MIIFIVLALLSISYGIGILSIASGSRFFLFWFFLGIIFLVCGAGIHLKWHLIIPRWLLAAAGCLILAGLAVFLVLTVKIGSCFESECDTPLDVIIVLGAQVKENGPSVVLKYRLDRAAEYLRENPGTVCIVTGAQGTNEPVTEGRGMADYLISLGIGENRIILEEKARNTEENIRFSKDLLPSEDAAVGIVTNNFHMYRALGIAKKYGLQSVTGLAAGSTITTLPNNVIREVLGVLKDTCCGNMIFW